MDPKTSNMSSICGRTSGRHHHTHDQYNEGKDFASEGTKKLGRVNLFFKLTSLWLKFEKHKKETLALNARSGRTSAVEKNNERITLGIADLVGVIHLYICMKD